MEGTETVADERSSRSVFMLGFAGGLLPSLLEGVVIDVVLAVSLAVEASLVMEELVYIGYGVGRAEPGDEVSPSFRGNFLAGNRIRGMFSRLERDHGIPGGCIAVTAVREERASAQLKKVGLNRIVTGGAAKMGGGTSGLSPEKHAHREGL